MIFSIAIYSPPSSQASYSAYRFAKAILEKGHTLYRVFFYHDGAYHGSELICSPQGEFDLQSQWAHLQDQYKLDLTVCIAAGLKRGIINEEEAERYEKKSANLSPHFVLSGLGELVDASISSDRLISFR